MLYRTVLYFLYLEQYHSMLPELISAAPETPVASSALSVSSATTQSKEVIPPSTKPPERKYTRNMLAPIIPVVTSTFSEYLARVQAVNQQYEKSFQFRDDGVLDRIAKLMKEPPKTQEVEWDDKLEIESENPLKQLQSQLLAARKESLSESEKQKVREILRGSTTSQQVLIDKFNIDMTREKFSCLRPGTWLNDEIINFYMQLLQEKDDNFVTQQKKSKTSHYFNSFFYTKLLENGQYQYSNVKRWTKKFDIFQKSKIFIPINLHNTHWTMLVIYMEKKEIHYYDSMSGSGKVYLQSALKWIQDEAKEKKNEIINTNEWKLIDRESHVPQQRNGYDCGMFSIYCADYVTDDLPLEYNQDEMGENRIRVGAAILRGTLNY
jgi:Ulp1 family protease